MASSFSSVFSFFFRSPGMIVGVGAFSGALMFMDGWKEDEPKQNLDIVASYVTVSPELIHTGEKVVFEHGIRNEGKRDLPGGHMDYVLYVEGKVVSSKKGWLPVLPGGGGESSLARGFHQWKAEKPGKYRYRLIVDEQNRVAESNENNNSIEGEIEVLPSETTSIRHQ